MFLWIILMPLLEINWTLNYSHAFVRKQLNIYMWANFWTLSFIPLIDLFASILNSVASHLALVYSKSGSPSALSEVIPCLSSAQNSLVASHLSQSKKQTCIPEPVRICGSPPSNSSLVTVSYHAGFLAILPTRQAQPTLVPLYVLLLLVR